MKRRAISLVTLALFSACATSQKTVSSVYQPTYEFTPATVAAVGEADLTVALVEPEWPGVEEWWATIAGEFARNMSLDFEEMLTARGIIVRGPFRTHDQMVYDDKRSSELMLTPRLDVTVTPSEVEIESGTRINLLGPSKEFYKIARGTVTLGGRVTLVVSEPFTEEKLWAPSIELDKRSASFVGEREYSTPPTNFFEEPQFVSAINRMLEEMYPIIMKECWDRLVPAELAVMKEQAMEIREKAGYEISMR